MMKHRALLFAFLLLPVSAPCNAATSAGTPTPTYGNPTITKAGTAMAIALPVIAGGIAISKEDWHGLVELGAETFWTVGTAYALKQIVRERRPDGSDYQSFPSGTTALSASGSSFLWGRYGWEYGLPAFVATQFVSYSRVQAKEHHWYDTLASSAISMGYAYFITKRFHPGPRLQTELSVAPDGGSFHLAYDF
jgi:membrane-associated phospholipid phosphatase